MALSINSMISDRYHLVRLIAIGGMGQVWEAIDQRLDRKVAIKVLKAEYSSNEEFIHRFRVEAKTTAALNNSGIAQVFDYGETPDESVGAGTLAYLVMELVYGEPLSAIINRKKNLSVDNTLDILEQTATALYAAHAVGLVHRDVKPGNILITDSGEVKITDFGIAKAADATPLTQTGIVMGTAQYISPEQALGQDATSASDIYALAVVGYEALCGKRPFTGDSPLSVAMQHINDAPPPLPSNIPLSVRNLLQHALEKNPEKRYRNGLEFAKAIRRVKIGSELPEPQKKSTGKVHKSTKKSPLPESIGRALPTHTGTLESAMRANAALESNVEVEENHSPITVTTDTKSRFMIISILIALLLIGVMVYVLFVHHAKTTPVVPSHPSTENVHIFPSSIPPKPKMTPPAPAITHHPAPSPVRHPTPVITHPRIRVQPRITHQAPPPVRVRPTIQSHPVPPPVIRSNPPMVRPNNPANELPPVLTLPSSVTPTYSPGASESPGGVPSADPTKTFSPGTN